MPYVNKPRPYKKEYTQQKSRDERGVDRTGKDIDHVVPLSKGGTNASKNLKLKSPKSNRSFTRNSNHTVKINKPKK